MPCAFLPPPTRYSSLRWGYPAQFNEDTGELSPGGIAIKIGGVGEDAYYLVDNIDAFTDSLLENLIDYLGLTSFLSDKSYRIVDEDYYMSNYG